MFEVEDWKFILRNLGGGSGAEDLLLSSPLGPIDPSLLEGVYDSRPTEVLSLYLSLVREFSLSPLYRVLLPSETDCLLSPITEASLLAVDASLEIDLGSLNLSSTLLSMSEDLLRRLADRLPDWVAVLSEIGCWTRSESVLAPWYLGRDELLLVTFLAVFVWPVFAELYLGFELV